MVVAERQIDDCLFQFEADGRLAMLQAELTTFFTAHELYCLLAFVKMENIANRVAQIEHERQRQTWELRG